MPKILLVEDNELNRDMLSRRLKRRGFDVLIAVDGSEGVSMATSELPDLILMDMSLPVMNGWQATQTLKAEIDTASIPIIALTAHAMVGDREEAMAAGCDDYDTKPVDFKRLLQKIEQQLQAAQTRPAEAVTAIESKSEHIVAASEISSEHLVAASSGVGHSESLLASVATATHSEQLTTPLIQTSSLVTHHPQHSSSEADLKLLVVDDNEANRDMLSRRLERKGYEVVLADSGESALQVIATTDIALVLLDIMMPGIGGIETLKQIRQSYSQSQLPVIMATAKDASENIVEALELGANDYITKPIDLPVALARIQTHLKTREASEVSQQQLVQSTAAVKPLSFWDERFRLVEVLSKHPMGQTAIAQDLQASDTPLRIIHTFRLDTNNPNVLQFVQDQFLAEMTILKQLQTYPQCLPLVSHLQDGEVFYMVHKYIEGTLLSKVLETTAPLSPKSVCKIADELLTVIDFLHQSQLIHSHPHPGCFLQPTEKSKKLVLIDYGIVTRILSKLSQHNPQYQNALQAQGDMLAPELMASRINLETDLYAIGKALLRALPMPETASDQLWGDLLGETTQIFAKMCQSNPSDRYASIYDASRAVRNHWHKLWKVELSGKLEQTR